MLHEIKNLAALASKAARLAGALAHADETELAIDPFERRESLDPAREPTLLIKSTGVTLSGISRFSRGKSCSGGFGDRIQRATSATSCTFVCSTAL